MSNDTPSYPDQVRRIWPDNDSACIHMQAGSVAFKLCDRAFACDLCPFDVLMRSGASRPQRTEEVAAADPEVRAGHRASDLALCFDPEAAYGAGFWYVRRRDENIVEVGLTEIGVFFLPPIREIILPRPGMMLPARQTSIWLIATEGTLGLTSPCAGQLRGVNPQALVSLAVKPEAAQQVWVMDIEVRSVRSACRGLMRGAHAAEYLQSQHRELMQTLENALEPLRKSLGPTSADGGARLGSIAEMLGSARYFQLVAPFYRR
ncbi:MAG TPA: hypothetical protein PKI62_07160 [bacterium]|nr:hypothetical protein [bacterium]HPR87227.1 hypothetical protein [bacterium]